MAKLTPFSRHEAVLLLDAYLETQNTELPRLRTVKRVSVDLRRMAINNDIVIDDVYRNVNGISSQMSSMESAYVGKTIVKPATRLFLEVVSLYRDNQSEYGRILKEARSMVNGKQTTEELFAAWLSQNAPSDHLSKLYLCYSEIETFCLRIKVLRKPLFETTDLDTVKRVQRTIMENRLFQLSHKKQMKMIVSAAQYYTAFIRALDAEAKKTITENENPTPTAANKDNAVKEIEAKPANNDIAENLETIFDSASWSRPVNLGEYVYSAEVVSHPAKVQEPVKSTSSDEDNPCTIDFRQSVILAYTRPVKVSYFDKDLHVGYSWTDVYVKLMTALYEDYADVVPVGESFTGTGRIDFGNQEQAKSMTAPKRVFMEMYIETNLSATNIVGKIKALLDICRVDYENVIIKYERKENTTPKVVKPQNTVISNASVNAPGESTFYSYLRDSLGMADSTCRSYVSAIRSTERFAADNRFASTKLYNCGAEEASNTVELLFENAEFLKLNEQQHNRFQAALNKLLDYMGISVAEPHKIRSTFLPPPTPIKLCPSYDTAPFERVLEERFVKGFRLGSTLDMKKFKRYYKELNDAVVDKGDSVIEDIIRSCGIVHEDKVFLPKSMLSEDVQERLYAYIDDAFASGKTSIYFEALFREFSEDFLDHYIYNADMLRSYLAFEYGEKYVIGKNQLSKYSGMTADPIDEVRSCLKEHGAPMEIDSLCAVLAHLPRNSVVAILGSNLEFVRNSKGEYFHADVLALSEEELDNILKLIENALRSHKFMSGTELMNAIRAKYPRTYESHSSYSTIGWRDALKYKFGDRFSFRGNIISRSGATLSMSDVFGQLAAETDTITVDELLAFAKEMGTVIYFDVVYENALRINEDTFVSKTQAAFQIRETDAILDRFCTGKYVPLSSFREFGIFPDAGFPWTLYLLESYAAYYSERYTLVHGGYNRSCAVGAIAQKSAGYGSFDDLIVDVIADSGIPLEKATALDYLVKSGYIARRSYAGIEELLIRANAQRNRKGRP